MELVPGTVIAGRYRLERLLATGGMGAVWVARHVTLGNDIAIKFMHGDPTELTAARSRFEREARTASSIRHPNVVTVHDYGIEGQTPYMAMELLHGENLDDFLLRKKRLTLDELEPIISQVSRGLRKAHETGVVHRDLKPSNVFLAHEDNDARQIVKILDFGIAKEIDATLSQQTKTTELMGSPHYMSPEQLRSTKKSDFRSDLWSLGVIIYRALTGVTPFPGDTLAEVMVQVFSGRWTPPSTLVPGLSPTVDAFFQRAFARKPDERFQSIHDMHNAFVAVVAGKPLPAPTPSAPAANPTTTPVPLGTSSATMPNVVVPPPRASAPSYASPDAPTMGLSSTDAPQRSPSFADIPPPPPLPVAPSAPSNFAAPHTRPPVASNPGLSPPAEATIQAGPMVGFGTPNHAPPVAPAWPENPQPITTLPEQPPREPFGSAHLDPRPHVPNYEPTKVRTNVGLAPERPRKLLIGVIAGFVLLLIGLVIALSGSGDSSDKPAPNPERSSVVVPNEPSVEVPPVATASGNALTPDEIASAVPDESPVEEVPLETPAPTPSTTQAPKSNWKLIPKGQARLLVKATGGVCKITINATYYGVTPLDVTIEAGKIRVFCRTPSGSTRSKELRVPEGRATKIDFDVKQ